MKTAVLVIVAFLAGVGVAALALRRPARLVAAPAALQQAAEIHLRGADTLGVAEESPDEAISTSPLDSSSPPSKDPGGSGFIR